MGSSLDLLCLAEGLRLRLEVERGDHALESDQQDAGQILLQHLDGCLVLKDHAHQDQYQRLVADPERLADIRRNRVAIMKENNIKEYTDLSFIKDEVNKSKMLFKKFNWPIIDVTRKSVEETAASILKILEIQKNK